MSSKAKAKGKSDPNKTSQKVFQKETFTERQWTEETKGDYDNDGFFVTPNGSFWDPDGVYFNKDGFDKHGGRYDSDGIYIPGEGWNERNNCYESEIEDYDEYDYQDDELGHNMLKEDDYENLDDDVFESDFQMNDPNFAQLFEGIKLEDNKKNEEENVNEIKEGNNNNNVYKN